MIHHRLLSFLCNNKTAVCNTFTKGQLLSKTNHHPLCAVRSVRSEESAGAALVSTAGNCGVVHLSYYFCKQFVDRSFVFG